MTQVGEDYRLDGEFLLPYDLKASEAHATMLQKIGVLTAEEPIAPREKGRGGTGQVWVGFGASPEGVNLMNQGGLCRLWLRGTFSAEQCSEISSGADHFEEGTPGDRRPLEKRQGGCDDAGAFCNYQDAVHRGSVLSVARVGDFKVTLSQEDGHTAIEQYITEMLGKSDPLFRSRNP